MHKTMIAVSVAALMVGGSSAFGATFEVSKQFSNTFGPLGNESVEVVGGPRTPVRAQAGGFSLKADPLGDFVAWCLDIANNLRLTSHYKITNTPFTPGGDDISSKVSTIENLFETGYSTLDLTLDDHSAGFQLALWEILYETDASFDVTDGTFKQVKSASPGSDLDKAEMKANDLLAGLGGEVTQRYAFTYLQSDPQGSEKRSQNLVTVSAVPLPAAGLLLVAGLGGLAMVRRRG